MLRGHCLASVDAPLVGDAPCQFCIRVEFTVRAEHDLVASREVVRSVGVMAAQVLE